MNARELETQHNLKKWAAIIKECRSSGMKILQWLEIKTYQKTSITTGRKSLKKHVLILLKDRQLHLWNFL